MNRYRIPVFFFLLLTAFSSYADECVILLHGLARTSNSMMPLQTSLSEAGYSVVNISYPSRKKSIEELAGLAIGEGLDECAKMGAQPVNFVTHSLGGILLRYYLSSPLVSKSFANSREQEIARSVMLGPPNGGSEVVDSLKNLPGFELLNGPAGIQLGTGEADLPKELGPVEFELGVIAGTRSINMFLSMFLPSPNDGKVSLESAKIEGMSDFVALPVNHSFMMRNKRVIDEVLNFLQHGHFQNASSMSYERG